MRDAGYVTGFIGKWGIGGRLPKTDFDFWRGFPGQGKYYLNEDESEHLTAQMGSDAIAFLDTVPDDNPFCLSISFKSPHVQDQDPRQFLHDHALDELYGDIYVPDAPKSDDAYFDALPNPVPQIAGKTGTTTNCVDAWFVGYSPDLVLVVWVGFDRVRSMGPRMTGSSVASPIWCEIFRGVLETRTDWRMSFDLPPDIIYRDISAVTGLLASTDPDGPNERIFRQVPFVKGTEPTEVSQGYQGEPYWLEQYPDMPPPTKEPPALEIPSLEP